MDKSIFDYIAENLSDDMKQTALDFANYLIFDCYISNSDKIKQIKAILVVKSKLVLIPL